MGKTESNLSFGSHQRAAGTVWGLMWGNGAIPHHDDHTMSKSEVLASRVAAANGQTAFRNSLPSSAQALYDSMSQGLRDLWFADAAYTGDR